MCLQERVKDREDCLQERVKVRDVCLQERVKVRDVGTVYRRGLRLEMRCLFTGEG